MKKVVNINLGGYPYVMDEDAYVRLHDYLERISDHFSESEGCTDIMHDIETRIAELFEEELKGRSIVSMKEVNAVVKVMGRPNDFTEDASSEESHTSSKSSSSSKTHSTKKMSDKKLYRDKDNKIIAGVCSGLSAYFGIKEPLWVRIIFAIIFFTSGITFFVYIGLWIFVPYAKSAADRLAMKGEPINVHNIAKTVEEGIETISEKIVDIGKEFSSKKS